MSTVQISLTTRTPEKSNGITDGNISSVYTDGVYSSSGNMQRHGDVRRFYRRTLPRDSN
jgi:hypothetical protein